ncbi:hypothetical protein DDZ14_08535 [Maritimibacter sp. 55A14]|uniref:hypothetical protein n=1 Tax=Maritimibacter sp. 55A14 TaxID=2174844 RepID=UPI000D616EB6|nr:hypothetical protein [Maritimibacter sp. 55A14]PWE32783.1 hypothetical protein DDZ14_08535 [Maritimibacter sp. 55A14]
MTIYWPLKDVGASIRSNYALQDGGHAFEPEAGAPLSRPRTTARVEAWKVETIAIREGDLAIFEDWFDDTLAKGTQPFVMTHPVTRAFRKMQVQDRVYSITPRRGGRFVIGMNVLVLPDASFPGTRKGELVENGDFRTGDFTGWTSVPSTFDLVQNDQQSADAIAQKIPAPYAVRMASNSGTAESMFSATAFAVDPAKSYRLQYDEVSDAAADGTFAVVVTYLDGGGTPLATDGSTFAPSGTSQPIHKSIDLPALPGGAVTAQVFVRRDANGTAGNIYLTNVSMVPL